MIRETRGWAQAMGTPFQWTRQIASHYGGTLSGTVISWSAKIKARSWLHLHPARFQSRAARDSQP